MDNRSVTKDGETPLVCQPSHQYRLQRERYQLLVDQAADGFYETDRSGTLTFFNEAICQIFGRARLEMENRKFWEFMDSDNARRAERGFNQIGAADRIHQLTWKIKRKNGQVHTLEVSARPVFEKDDGHVGFRGIIRDVTHKIEAQAAIIKSRKKIKELYAASQAAERRYRAFLQFLPLPLLVQNNDFSVAYLNPAFERTFGWKRQDLELNPLAHIPADQLKTTQTGKLRLLHNGALSGVETKRLTKDGRTLDVINDGAMFYDAKNQPAGMVTALRDVTQSRKDARTSRSLFKIAEALHHYSDLDSLLTFISQQVQSLLQVRHAHIILVDDEKQEYYFRAGVVQASESYHPFSEIRVSLDGTYFAGQVILSGKPRIVNNFGEEQVRLIVPGDDMRNIMGVPMELGRRTMGAMVVTNKIDDQFSQDDVALLSSIARMVSLPIENARINDELRNSYEKIKALNRAKDHIIEHLSHELRTPLSVLSASLSLLIGDACPEPDTAARILARCQRNLNRITDMQSKIADITRNPHQRTHQTLTSLLELCTDELESLADQEMGPEAGSRIRRRIDRLFKPRHMRSRNIELGPFVQAVIEQLKPDFIHRQVHVVTDIRENTGHVHLPAEVLTKIVSGLVRNAVEYTPDGGKIDVTAAAGGNGPVLTVADTGVGITRENKRLIFGNFFTTVDISRYATGKPYDFNAGGTGFDLLRMQVFAEQYGFHLTVDSQRCPHIPANEDRCPGRTADCSYCDTADHCHHSGGTRFTVWFGKPKPSVRRTERSSDDGTTDPDLTLKGGERD